MSQFIKGSLTTKTPAEFDYHGIRGTPYCAIYQDELLKKNRIYLLDTRNKLYYPLAEWDKGDREANDKWYKYLLAIEEKIVKEKHRLNNKGVFELDKVEQIVPDEDKMIKDLKDDTWSLFIGSSR